MERQHSMTVMQQIEDLKNWHKQQEKLFQKDQLQNKDYTSQFRTKPNTEFFPLKSNETNLSDSIEIPKIMNYNKPFDEMPIKPAHSGFNQLIEDGSIGYENNTSKPKRKFLKKGEGIARFRMPQRRSQIKTAKPFQVKKSEGEMKYNSYEAKDKVINNKSGSKALEDLSSLTSTNLMTETLGETVPFSWESYLNSLLMPSNNPDNSIQSDSINHSLPESFLEKITSVRKNNAREREETKIFELLEQRALDSSFCSSSSTIIRLMENSIKSTPVKDKPLPIIEKNEYLNIHQEEFDQLEKEKTDNVNGNEIDKDESNNLLNQSLHVRFREENSYRSIKDYSGVIHDESKISEDNYYGDKTQWSDCDCSTQYSSSDEDTRPISPPNLGPQNVVTVEIKSNKKQVGDIILHTVDQNGTPLEDIRVDRKTLKAIENINKPNENSEKQTDVLISNCGKTLQNSSDLQNLSSTINLRLKELEDEIEIFQKENAKLKKKQSDFEQEYKKFKNEQKTFNLQIEEERRKNVEFLEEEKQKLAKEKLVFEKYTRNLNKNPNKEERKEIQILKEQLSAIKEELAKKESRWGAAQARVRNQVKLLEEDNKKLKEEIEVIRKQSQKTNTLKKERISNTHLLHAISEQLTKISPIDLTDAFALKDTPKATVKKHVGNKKVTQNHQLSKITPANMYEDLSSDSEKDYINVMETKNSLEKDIKKIVEEAMFEPIASLQVKCKESQENLKGSEGSANKDVVKEVVKRIPDPILADDIIEESTNQDGNKEILYNDGRREIRYTNGNVKKINPNGDLIKIVYYNGDVKEICKDGTVKYYYGESRIWHTTYPDGLEILDFPSGQVERRHLNGTVEILYPNECRKLCYTNGSEEWIYKDGTVLNVDAEKQEVLILPNGQKEIHTKEHKRREYPDGTVKLIYPDGTQETRYSNGRIRLKDKDGNLIMDSG